MGVRDPRRKPKISVAQNKTHGHVYHLDLELSDRIRYLLGMDYPLSYCIEC